MAEAKEIKPRTFVKNGPNGERLTRTVTGPASEVEAKFDGFFEETTKTSSASGGSSGKSTS
jgi:hypothetical protein